MFSQESTSQLPNHLVAVKSNNVFKSKLTNQTNPLSSTMCYILPRKFLRGMKLQDYSRDLGNLYTYHTKSLFVSFIYTTKRFYIISSIKNSRVIRNIWNEEQTRQYPVCAIIPVHFARTWIPRNKSLIYESIYTIESIVQYSWAVHLPMFSCFTITLTKHW